MKWYSTHKGVNAPLEFRGLKGPYITLLAVGLTGLLLAFSVMYTMGAGTYLSLAVILVAGSGLFRGVYYLNHRFGPHGLMQLMARRRMPRAILISSRKLFLKTDCDGKDTGKRAAGNGGK